MKLATAKNSFKKWVLGASLTALPLLAITQACGNQSSAQSGLDSTGRPILGLATENLKGCEKRALIWNKIEGTKYNTLAEWGGFDLFSFAFMNMSTTMDHISDEMPNGRRKLIHTNGSVAQVRFEANPGQPFTGIYKGNNCGLVRISAAVNPDQFAFTPGMGLKFLVDGKPSENIIAMYSLDGQGDNRQPFANTFSNVIDDPSSFALKALKTIFERASKHATHIAAEHLSEIDSLGGIVAAPVAPEKLSFVPTAEAQAPVDKDGEFRNTLTQLNPGVTLYNVYAKDSAGKDAGLIGKLILESKFVSSIYGDENLFFRHRRFKGE